MENTAPAPRRWDPIVKLTHWGVVIAVIGNALVTEEGSGWHIWVGYGLAALLGLRLLWGLIGTRNARFSAFPPSPSRAIDHLGEIGRGEVTRHPSHNPLGALMAYAIWATLLVISASGIAMSGPPPADPAAVSGEHGEGGEKGENEEGEEARERQRAAQPAVSAASTAPLARGEEREDEDERAEARERSAAKAAAPAEVPAASEVAADRLAAYAEGAGIQGEEEGGEEILEEVHEIAVNLLYVLIALHLMGVVFETRRSGREIVRAMLPGGNRPA